MPLPRRPRIIAIGSTLRAYTRVWYGAIVFDRDAATAAGGGRRMMRTSKKGAPSPRAAPPRLDRFLALALANGIKALIPSLLWLCPQVFEPVRSGTVSMYASAVALGGARGWGDGVGLYARGRLGAGGRAACSNTRRER